jgi:uncharacterized membrane protein HdeD (DUF308 family)
MQQTTSTSPERGHSALPAVWSVLLIITGAIAIAVPMASSLGISMVLSWLVVVAGIFYLAHAFSVHSAGAAAWRVLIGVIYVAAGLYLVLHPAVSLASFTLLFAALFFAEGVLQIVAYSQLRTLTGHGHAWLLADGILTLLLGAFITLSWPYSALWVIGTIVGINLIVSGVARLFHFGATRGSEQHRHHPPMHHA